MMNLGKNHFVGGMIAAAFLGLGAVSANAAIPVYPNPGIESTTAISTFSAANTGFVRAWFVGNGGAAYTVKLGAIVNGVDRGLGLNNQASALGELHNYGAINAGDLLRFYISVTNTGDVFDSNPANNADGKNHIYYELGTYTGGDFGIPLDAAHPGSYFGFEDLYGGGDFNYTDMQFVVRLGGLAVPEPAAWAMIITGFGLVGGAMRRRQKVSVTYA